MSIGSLLGPRAGRHDWRFFRAGGFDQVKLDRGSDLCALDELDQKLWLALSCPTRGLEFDTATLDLIDTDKDGRIRVPEILAAVRWACASLKNPEDLLKGAASLDLDAINDATDEGKRLITAARIILKHVAKPDATAVAVEDTADTTGIYGEARFNGDGIVPVDSADDEQQKKLIEEIIACEGGENDAGGKPGVSEAKVSHFWADLQAYSDWWTKGEADAKRIWPLGDSSGPAGDAIRAVREKVEDYFLRARLAAFDPRALDAFGAQEKIQLEKASEDMAITMAEVAAFPLATAEAGKPLPLKEGLNPAWRGAMEGFRSKVVETMLGVRETLTEEEWRGILDKFEVFDAWQGSKAGTSVEQLGITRVREILKAGGKEALLALVAKDKLLENDVTAIASVARLVRYNRDLFRLLNNYVNFRDFYGPKREAIFQAGRLYLDQRCCDLCVRVEDMAKHGLMAHLSYAYLVYCEVTRKATGEKMTIAAAMMNGDSDNLMVGRNGIFYDRQGRDWDATIMKIVDNPISIRQAFWAPYKRLVRWIGDQIAKRAAAADVASDQKLLGSATSVPAATPPAAPAAPKRLDVGAVAALGVAGGFISTAFMSFLGWLSGTGQLVPLYVALLILVISLPSMILAAMKLRLRNLGPILDANGWAVNAKAKVNIPFGASLTQMARLPPGSRRDLVDPFEQKERWKVWLTAGVVAAVGAWAAWYYGGAFSGLIHKSEFVMQREADAAKAQKAKEEAATKPTTQPAASAPAVTPSPST